MSARLGSSRFHHGAPPLQVLYTPDGKSLIAVDNVGIIRAANEVGFKPKMWGGAMVDLSLTEFRIVALLAGKVGDDVGYREIYDLVHGKDFVAGAGEEGYRANVRTLIKRIRKSFREVDPGFAQIENYAGFGYRWIPEE